MSSRGLAYLITGSNLIFYSWEWLFLFFVSFYYINKPYGGLITSIIFITNAIVRFLFSKTLAKLANKFQEKNQYKYSLLTRSTIFLLTLFLPLIDYKPEAVITWALIVHILFVYDSYLVLNLKYRLADSSHLSLIQSSSIYNLGRRGAVVITSHLAYIISRVNFNILTLICILLILFGIFAGYLTLIYQRRICNTNGDILSTGSPDVISGSPYALKEVKSHIYLAAVILFLLNLFFGSGSVLFIRAIEKYNLLLTDNITVLTIFYVGFVFINFLGMRLSSLIGSRSTLGNVIGLYILTAVLGICIANSYTMPVLCSVFSFLQGILYGLTILIFNGMLLVKIRGQFQNELYATVDSWGRLGFILSQLITGIFLDFSLDTFSLMNTYSVLSILALLPILAFTKKEVKDAPVTTNL